MTSSNHYDFILRDLEREIAHHERTLSKKQQPPQKPPAPLPTSSLRCPANPSPGSGPVASLSVTSPCSMQPPEVASPSWPSPWLPALVELARGLYTTAHHLCLVHFTDRTSPVPNVPSVSNVPSPQNPPLANSSERDIVAVPAIPVTDHTTSTLPPVPNVPNVSNPAHSTSEVTQQPIDTSPASLESAPKDNGKS